MTAPVETLWPPGFLSLAVFLWMALPRLLWGVLLLPPHNAAPWTLVLDSWGLFCVGLIISKPFVCDISEAVFNFLFMTKTRKRCFDISMTLCQDVITPHLLLLISS